MPIPPSDDETRPQEPSPDSLHVSEERFRLLVESVKEYAIFMLDPRGIVSSWNVGAERIKGYRAYEIVGQHFSRFYPEEEVRAGKCELELEVAAREGRFEEEGWRVRKDGTLFWANVVITALRDPSGELVGFAKVTRDLTERRHVVHRRQIVALILIDDEEIAYGRAGFAICGGSCRRDLQFATRDRGIGCREKGRSVAVRKLSEHGATGAIYAMTVWQDIP